MAGQNFLSLLDITKRRGTDAAVGTVEEVITFAPELEKVMGRAIPGTSYNARIRSALSGGGAFRKANQGSLPGASTYEQRRFNCHFFDSVLEVDEAIARAAEQEGDSLATLQADEAEGALRAKTIALGKQFYQGSLFDPNGPPGLIDFLGTYSLVTDSRTNKPIVNVVDAGGSSANCEIIWYVWMHEQGVHFLWGANQGIDIKPWQLLPVADANDPAKKLWKWTSNLSGFIGLSAANAFSVFAVINVDNTLTNGLEAKPFTDKLDANLMALMPVGYRPNLCFMSKASQAGLQKARTVTLFGQLSQANSANSGAASSVAPLPTMTGSGIPIVVTDSILTGSALTASQY